jgi:hypothetical protein
MGQKDISEKILMDYNDVFADIINGLVFGGRERMLPEALENVSVHSQYKDDDGVLHEEERDSAKHWKAGKTTIAICGVENQSGADKRMPVRVIGYDGAEYRKQLDNETVAPVVTIVLYFGTDKRWTKPRRLKELLEIPEGLEDYVNDYKINVFEIAWLSEEEVNRFTGDFRIVADFFRQKRINPEYVPDDMQEIRHVDEVLKLLSVMTGDDRYMEVSNGEKGKVKNMCEVAQRLVNNGVRQGREEGRAEGRAEGMAEGKAEGIIETAYDFGLSDKDILERLQSKLNVSLDQAQQYLNMFGRKKQ